MRLKQTDNKISQNKFAHIINKNPNPVLQITKEGIISYANKAGLWFLNFWNKQINEHVPDQFNNVIMDAFNTNSYKVIESEYGTNVFSLTFVPMAKEGFINIYITNITPQKQLQEKTTQLEKLNILNMMSSEIAHEINTPIGAFSLCVQESMKYFNKIAVTLNHLEMQIDSISRNMDELRMLTVTNSGDMMHSQVQDKYTQIMNNLEGCEKECKRELQTIKTSESHLREYLESSIKESLHCKEAVNNLLSFANQVALYKKNYCVNALITDVLVSLYRIFNENKIDIVFNLSDNLPDISIDICKMELVFSNIFYNAVYAIKALTNAPTHIGNHFNGTITIETRMCINKDEIEISISDTGAYIHKNNLKKIFTPFFTQRAENERPIIGLGIAGKIIRMHNGVIAAESEKETGTTFRIYLPLKENISKRVTL